MGQDTELVCRDCREFTEVAKDWSDTESIKWFLARHQNHTISAQGEYGGYDYNEEEFTEVFADKEDS